MNQLKGLAINLWTPIKKVAKKAKLNEKMKKNCLFFFPFFYKLLMKLYIYIYVFFFYEIDFFNFF